MILPGSAWLTAALLFTLPGAPRQGSNDGWGLMQDDANQTTIASVAYSTGNTIAVICRAGQIDVLLTGMPETAEPTRIVGLQYDSRPTDHQSWLTATTPTSMISGLPGPNVRRLRVSQRLAVTLSLSPDERPRRYVLDLPTDPSGLDQVMIACNQPLTNPRDDLPVWDMLNFVSPRNGWARMPRPEFPQAAASAGIPAGYAILSCVVGPGGIPQDCQTEKESDPRGGFGVSALEAMTSARIRMSGEGRAQIGQLFRGTIRFQIR